VSARAARGQWCVYLVRCRDGSLYTGVTNHLEQRLARHNAGRGAAYTRSRRPVELVMVERAADRGSALSREAAIKKLPRAHKLALVASAAARASRRPARAARRGRSGP
jgi:putative endonuclease